MEIRTEVRRESERGGPAQRHARNAVAGLRAGPGVKVEAKVENRTEERN